MNKEDTIPEGKVKRSCQLKLIYKMSLVMSVMLESFLAFLGSSKQSKDLFLKKGLIDAEMLCSYSKTCFCFVSNF